MANLFDSEPRTVYERVVLLRRSSIDALVDLVPPQAEVLDVGVGDGALGERLVGERRCVVDGVTLSAEEAQRAAARYRRVEVADLDRVPLQTLFAGRRYGVIVCADVLEHLVRPAAILDSCHELLADDGWLLLSVPNAGYSGLVGELLGGDFAYRLEGLLDRTHLRFFTRRSLLRMLDERGWRADRVEPIEVDLPDSEFAAEFDRLPPAVHRFLLSMPDALSYQFVVRARPAGAAGRPALQLPPAVQPAPPLAPHYSTLVYLRTGAQYSEQFKVAAGARMGEARQTVRYVLPRGGEPLAGIRFDPADRPGLLHLFAIRLLDAEGGLLWEWDRAAESLARGMCQQVLFRTPWFVDNGVVLLLAGDDPFFELPIDAPALARCRDGGLLEVELAWPMSADYVLFMNELARHRGREADLARQAHDLAAERDARAAEARRLGEEAGSLANALAQQRSAGRALKAHVDEQRAYAAALRGHVEAWQAHAADQRLRIEALQEHVASLQAHLAALRAHDDELGARFDRIVGSRPYRWLARGSEAVRSLGQRSPPPAAPAPLQLRTPAVPEAPAVAEPGPLPAEPPLIEPVEMRPVAETVGVIVPVYRGLEDTRTCLESLLASTASVALHILIINDASPEPEVTSYLRQLRGRDPRIELLENETNAGFVQCANLGMSLNTGRDVILLNSDTEVAGDWIDRLRRAAYREPRIGTVTPFSNNATICSYPRFCAENPLPADTSVAALDRYFATENRDCHQDIPTAVGFCMYIRRACIDEVGVFDAERFGRGYGEENDFSMRARAAGWRNVLALDTFVRHAGGVSFGEEKTGRVHVAQQTLARLHPQYAPLVVHYIEGDPALPARLRVDLARIRASARPSVLLVTHVGGGGTERHVRELAAALATRANLFLLCPTPAGDVLLEWLREGEQFRLSFELPAQHEDLLQAMRALGVAHVHYHHLQGHAHSVRRLHEALGASHDFTVHDFHVVCPQVTLSNEDGRYCGERGIEQCRACLARRPAADGMSIEDWRERSRQLLRGARRVFAPSGEAAARLRRYFPELEVTPVPHLDMTGAPPVRAPRPLGGRRPLRIAVIGALNPAKGADLLDAVATVAGERGSRLQFHLVGWAYRPLRTAPQAPLTVHGEYAESDLPGILAGVAPDLVWFTALWPETYSYTLSAALSAQLPIVAPDLGAFPERLSGRPWTWICGWDREPLAWVEFFEGLVRDHFDAASEPFPAPRRDVPPADFSYPRDYLSGVDVRPDRPPLEWMFLWQHRVRRWPGQRALP